MGPLDLLTWLELVAVAGFAASAALAAAERRADLVTLCVVAVVGGLAGGSLRDLLTHAPVFWIDRPAYLAVCLAAGGLAWGLGERPWRERALVWFDAVALAAYASVSAARAADAGVMPLVAAVLGVLAAATGALVRDGVRREAPLLLGRGLYLASAVAAVVLFVLLRLAGIGEGLAALVGAAAGLGLRAGAVRFGWSLRGAAPD